MFARFYGTPTPSWFTVAKGDLGPGHHVFHALITVPHQLTGMIPFKVDLAGFPQKYVPPMPIQGIIECP